MPLARQLDCSDTESPVPSGMAHRGVYMVSCIVCSVHLPPERRICKSTETCKTTVQPPGEGVLCYTFRVTLLDMHAIVLSRECGRKGGVGSLCFALALCWFPLKEKAFLIVQ